MTDANNRHLPVLSRHAGPLGAPDRIKGPAAAEAPFAAQILGQGGTRRGLKGGEAVLKAATGAYLGAEYSGEHDRRFPKGFLKRTAV